MTVVNPKSISGITSITTASGSDDLLTIHTNNGTERLRIDSTGATKIVTGIVTTLTATGSAKVGSGVTLSPDGNIFTTGVTTATTFVGALTGNVTGNVSGNVSGGVIAGSTGATFIGDVSVSGANITLQDSGGASDDRLVFGAGSDLSIYHNGTHNYIDTLANKMHLRVSNGEDGIVINSNGAVELYNDNTKRLSTTGNGADIFGSGASSAYLKLINTSATSNNSHQFTIDGYNADNTYWNKIQIDASEVLLKTYTGTRATLTNTALTFASGVNIAMTSGNGIDFSDTTDASGMSNELLDDYEEGSFTPAFKAENNSSNADTQVHEAAYTKVGNLVYFRFYITLTSHATGTTGGSAFVTGLPFTNVNGHSSASIGYFASWNANQVSVHVTVQPSSNSILFRHYTSASSATNNMDYDNNLQPNSNVIISGCYQTA